MIAPERQARLRDLLGKQGIASLEMLAAELGVSHSTVRRDLDALEGEGLVKRTHGGAMWVGDASTPPTGARPYAFDQRLEYNVLAKQRIARAAKSLVQPGQTVLLDGGTTTFFLAMELATTQLQLVTNSLPIANLMLNNDSVELVLTGGLMYPRYGVLLGPTAETALDQIHTKTLFLSVAGLHNGELFNQNMLLVQAELKMMERAQEVVLLIDSGKFGQQALVRLCGLDQIDVIVTDAEPPAADRKRISDAGCKLIIAA
ncbi:MAG TPA: DeoR/GlpR family DNA-binding transcription regulator [Tepidisphaeraceae bacterium]|nr:DeoR/GlpR family DNA-binding transcription regulator [Tepidisphaeraceae bacterium]